MSLTINGGVARGFSLFVPKGDTIRPTSVRLKRKFFDSNQNWSDKIFVDLCAGSGAMGLEAWSRGASEVVLVENNKKVLPILKKNIERLKQSYKDEFECRPIQILSISAEKFFTHGHSVLNKSDSAELCLFFDPPYHLHALYEKVLLSEVPKFKEVISELWVESDHQKGLGIPHWEEKGLVNIKAFTQGASYIGRFDLLP